jgi:hypothetical protein
LTSLPWHKLHFGSVMFVSLSRSQFSCLLLSVRPVIVLSVAQYEDQDHDDDEGGDSQTHSRHEPY